ncbi:MAG: class I SAM-dependent methyltransferase [Deltaproteobacteria bacterium]|nr:class I SAM-dependent methyltransferase [Deltaproteobacteria bacterium]
MVSRCMLEKCRFCSSSRIDLFLDLGQMPLVNSLLAEQQLEIPEPKYPLSLVFCSDCCLVQLGEIVPPESLFSEYLYFSSFSEEMVEQARQISEKLIQKRNLTNQSLVVEIASNDGYLLQWYQKSGIPILGIEPAQNIAKIAQEEKKIPTIVEFFGIDLGIRLRKEGKLADVIHANNVMAHVPDMNGFIRGIGQLIKPGGLAVIEVPYVIDMIDKCEFDTIYHEHVFYFSVTALDRIFKKHDLLLSHVDRIKLHGGSLRLFVIPMHSRVKQEKSVLDLIKQESEIGANQLSYYKELASKISTFQEKLLEKLVGLKKQGKSIAAYGASAKGCILLNSFGIGKETIDFVVDKNIYKQGKLMPGVHIPIKQPSELLEKKPDYVLLLTWNFADEILAQQAEYRRLGGKFIIPQANPYEV